MRPSNPDRLALEPLRKEAKEFIAHWACTGKIHALKLEFDGGDMFAVYLIDFEALEDSSSPARVIVGDFPPALLFESNYQNLHDALEGYADGLEEWADAVECGETDMSPYLPVLYRGKPREIEPTTEQARIVRGRVHVVREAFLPRVT